jgi:hypothetical protein
MAKTQSKIITESVKPLYAVAGATEVAYEFARGYTIEAQKTAAERLNKIEREPKALQNQAVALVNARVAELQKDAKDAQAKFEARVAELQKEARALPKKVQTEIDDTVTELARTYADLVDRGEKIVALIRKDGVKAVTAVRKAPNKSSVVRREKAKVASDKPSNSSRPVKKSATKKPVAKKTPAKTTAKKATATKKAATQGAQSTAKSAQTTAKKAATTASNTAAAATA